LHPTPGFPYSFNVKTQQQERGDQPAIELTGLGLLRGDTWILHDINWTVPAGTCVAILGPNGSGKSTLSRIIGCHVWPTAGECKVLGGMFGDANLPELRKRIRLVQPAGPYDVVPELTAQEAVVTGFLGTIGLYDHVTDAMRAEAVRLLRLVGLSHVADHRYETLSSGERMRCLLARAMAVRPALLLLDEPTAGLDLLAREQVLATVESLLREPHPPTVVMITHHVEELPPATSDVLLLKEGKVAACGLPADVLTSPILSDVYGFPVQVRYSGGRYYVEVHPSAWDQLLTSPITPARQS
jgi:iron complex transport system ATP-binding protein